MSTFKDFPAPRSATRSWGAAALVMLANMFERMAYYGVRALMILYMIYSLELADSDAYVIYGLFTVLVYVLPLLFGMVVDFLIDKRYAMILGSLMMGIGGMTLLIPGEWAMLTGIAIMAAGSGFFKGTISAYFGTVFPGGPKRLDGGYTLFYMFINVGALLATTVIAWIGDSYGFGWGFFVAAMCAFMASAVILLGTELNLLQPDPETDLDPKTPRLRWESLGLIPLAGGLVTLLVFILLASWLSDYRDAITVLLVSFSMLIGLVLTFVMAKREQVVMVLVTLLMMIGTIIFWSTFELLGSTLVEMTNQVAASTGISRSLFESLNPALIGFFGAGLCLLWLFVRFFQSPMATVAKMMAGAFFLGVANWILWYDISANSVGLSTVLLHTTFATFGELLFSPLFLSLAWKSAPGKIRTTFFGFIFGSYAIANYVSAAINSFFESRPDGEEAMLVIPILAVLIPIFLGGLSILLIYLTRSAAAQPQIK